MKNPGTPYHLEMRADSLYSNEEVSHLSTGTSSGTSKTMLNKNGESEYPCLVPDFKGNAFSFSPLSMILTVGLSYVAFIMLQ